MVIKSVWILAFTVLLSDVLSVAIENQGPGIPKIQFKKEELFKPLSTLKAPAGLGHGWPILYKGYLVVPHIKDGGVNGGWGFFDISNPRSPRMVFEKRDNETADVREQLSWGLATVGYGGKTIAAIAAWKGVQFWDWTQPEKMSRLSYLELPGVTESSYDRGVFSLFYQAPYVYAAGVSLGFYVIDASNPSAPKLIKHVKMDEAGGFRTGWATAVGNVLVVSDVVGPTGQGFALFDISNPAQPRLLDAHRNKPSGYSTTLYGDMLYAIGRTIMVYDISDHKTAKPLKESGILGSEGAYMTLQDDYIHGGFSNSYVKVDRNSLAVVGKAHNSINNIDEDHAVAFGNLVFSGDDHAAGSSLYAHQESPDLTPPVSNMISPRDSAIEVPVTSRIGLTLTDAIDPTSLTAEALIVKNVQTGELLEGWLSSQHNIVNFTPLRALNPQTSYEVVLVAGKMRDYAGNAIAISKSFRFSTGNALASIERGSLRRVNPLKRGQAYLRSPASTLSLDARGRLILRSSQSAAIYAFENYPSP